MPAANIVTKYNYLKLGRKVFDFLMGLVIFCVKKSRVPSLIRQRVLPNWLLRLILRCVLLLNLDIFHNGCTNEPNPYEMKVVIIGARPDGQAKVVLEILLAEKKYQPIGFIDDDPSKHSLRIRGLPVLGGMSDLPRLIEAHQLQGGIVALGNCRIRRELGQQMKALSLSLINTIHPTAHLDSDVTLGEGLVVSPQVSVITGSVIGDSVNLLTGATVDHDNRIDSGVVLSPGVHTSGRVHIGQDVFVGTGAILLPDAQVGIGAYIGAGAVVLRAVPAGEIWAGVPAKKLSTS
jgi:sugar O-acyltransferase (sialic acid O-acetyltransferase NeuD family)